MKSPAFQFYPSDFLADENVVLMSNQEIGCYIKLLCYCWREGSIPNDVSKIARLCGEQDGVMAQLWLAIGSCFSEAQYDTTRLVNPRLIEERIKQENHHIERSESGKRGANSRWNKDNGSANGKAKCSAKKQPIAKNGSSSSSSSSKKKENIKRKKSFETAEVLLSEDFIEIAKQIGINGQVKTVFESFRDHHVSKGNRFVDWTAAWRNWCRNQIEWGKVKPSQSGFLAAPWPTGGSR